MTALAPRRCALVLLCALLALATVLVHAESTTVTSSVTMLDKSFDGDIINIDMYASTDAVVTLQVSGSQVSGSGLIIQSASADGGSTRLGMSMASTVVRMATITFSGAMPSNSDIRIVSTTGTLASKQSLFEFSGLAFGNNVTVTVENTTVMWPDTTINTGSAVLISAGSSNIGITNIAAFFVLGTAVSHGASVVSIQTQSPFTVSNRSIFTVDHSRCHSCSGMLVDIKTPLVVTGASLFRVSRSVVFGTSQGLLSTAGSTRVHNHSAYIIDSNVMESGVLFSFPTGASDPQAVYPFIVSDNSIASFLSLEGHSTGLSASQGIPNDVDDSSRVITGVCKINNSALATINDYKQNGLEASVIVDEQGVSGGTCANARCVPGNIVSTSPIPTVGEPCSCTCSSPQYMPPSCTPVDDPTQTYNPTLKCELSNCATCDRINPSKACTKCAPDYSLAEDKTCKHTTSKPTTSKPTTSKPTTSKPTTSQPTTSKPTTSKPTTSPPKTSKPTTSRPPRCVDANCESCSPSSNWYCRTCKIGYYVSEGSCIPDVNVAAGARTAVLAAAVCVAAALYTL